jgi:hypothetical protein
MSDYGTMKSRIAREIERDDRSTEVAEAIQSAIGLWDGTRFWFNEKVLSLNTVASQEYYAMSALLDSAGAALLSGEGLIEIDSFTLTYSNQPYPLNERTQGWMDMMQATSATYTGQPSDYSIFGNQIRLHPIPDAVYSCTISGLSSLSTLSADGDTNAWMTSGEALIRNQAKVLLYRDIIRDMDGVGAASQAMAEALSVLSRKTNAKVMTGRITPWVL